MSEPEITETYSNQKIARNFGNAVSYYHKQARVQKKVARRLIASLEPWRDILPPGPILEVGCGTGFVTEELVKLYPERQKVITDLSPQMVHFCRNKFNLAENIIFDERDAEQIWPDQPEYAMTVSGFVAQWFKDTALTLGRLMEATLPGGLLLASFPGSESFPEWKQYCRELGIPYTGNMLPDIEKLVIKMSTGPVQIDFYEDTVKEKFPSARDFFRHLKRLGAGTRQGGRSLTASEMNMLIRHWDAEAGGEIEVSYHVIFLAAKRDYTS